MSFTEGLARVIVDDKSGYIDKNGQMVITPQFRSGGDFSEGLAPVLMDDKWGYIDQTGQKVLQLGRARWGFSDGLTIVGDYPNRVYMDKQGRVIAPYEVGSEF